MFLVGDDAAMLDRVHVREMIASVYRSTSTTILICIYHIVTLDLLFYVITVAIPPVPAMPRVCGGGDDRPRPRRQQLPSPRPRTPNHLLLDVE